MRNHFTSPISVLTLATAAFVLLLPIVALAAVDQGPFNEPNDGGPITFVTVIVVIVYFILLALWTKQLILFLGVFIVGAIIHRWFGEPFGLLTGVALFIWGYKELIHEDTKPPNNP
jgi:hypothetical protein